MPNPTPPFRIASLVGSVFIPSTLYSIGEYALIPVIPASAERLGASIPVAGFVAGLVMLGLLLADLPAARLVARIGERKAMAWASVSAFVAVLLGFLVQNIFVLGLAVTVVGSSSAVFYLARHAYMTEHVPHSHRARALSLLGGTFRAGAFIGPLVSAGIIALFGVPAIFVFSLVVWVATAISLVTTKDDRAFEPSESPLRHTFHIANRERKKLATVGVGAMMIGVLRTTRQIGLPLWAIVIGMSPDKSTFYIGIAAIIDFALFYTSGQIMDRFGRRASAVPTMIGLGLTHIALFLATNEPMFLVIAVLMSLANGLGSGLVLTLGSDLAPADARSEFLAGYRLLIDTGVAAAPPVLSLMAATIGLAAGMASFGVLGLGSVWLLYRYIPIYAKSPTKS